MIFSVHYHCLYHALNVSTENAFCTCIYVVKYVPNVCAIYIAQKIYMEFNFMVLMLVAEP